MAIILLKVPGVLNFTKKDCHLIKVFLVDGDDNLSYRISKEVIFLFWLK